MNQGKGPVKQSGGGEYSQRVKSYQLKLYVAGNETNSRKAIETTREICQKCLGQNYELKIIDVFKDYKSALEDKILVAPTLVWMRKGAPAFLIGNFDRQKLLDFLGLTEIAGGEE